MTAEMDTAAARAERVSWGAILPAVMKSDKKIPAVAHQKRHRLVDTDSTPLDCINIINKYTMHTGDYQR
jgi:hypothetical protein